MGRAMDCLFCAIAAGDIPCAKVYEDDKTLAFLDIRPLARGHTLVIPKAHAMRLEESRPEDAVALLEAVRRVVPAMCQTLDIEDTTVAINNGPTAGQEVPHVHVHIVPRTEGDAAGPIHALFTDRPPIDQDDLEALAASMAGVTA